MAEHPAASPVPAPSEPTEIPERERWLWENRDAYHSVMEGIRQAALGMVAPPASGPPPREELSRDCPECARVIAEIGGVPGGVVAEQVRAKMYAFDMAMDELRQLRADSSGGTTPSEEPFGTMLRPDADDAAAMRPLVEARSRPASPVAQPDAPSEDNASLAKWCGQLAEVCRLTPAPKLSPAELEMIARALSDAASRLSASPPSGARTP